MVEEIVKDESENAAIIEDFANASMIFYKKAGLSDEEYDRLSEEFFRVCREKGGSTQSVRLYISAEK